MSARPPRTFPGAVFGRLTLQSIEGVSPSGRSLWLCKCECGNTPLIANNNLVSNRTTSCGCAKKERLKNLVRSHKHPQPEIGSVYGKLTVAEFLGINPKTRKREWRCACECGGTRFTTSSDLTAGNHTSCGCNKGIRKDYKARAKAAPKATRMSIKPELRTADGSSIGAWTKTAAKKPGKAHTDLGPWRPSTGSAHITPPAQRAASATICPAPRFNHRYGVDPESVPRLFSAMRPGQYLEAAA